jgi:DHA1 family bicyclomycin/chloramphenicol resistance-like MFS transporter
LYILPVRRLLALCSGKPGFAVIIVSGVLVCTLGRLSPWAFAATLLPSTIASSFIAPPSRFLMLSQVSGDSGSASSLMGAVSSIFGSAGITVTSLGLGNHIAVVGGVNILLGLLCGGAWIFLTSRPFLRDVRR